MKQNDLAYSSIHYILVPKNPTSEKWQKCELQVRTIHEEAWSEFSHEFAYPNDSMDPLARTTIKRLSRLLHLAEDMVADIRRAPADGRLFQRGHYAARSSSEPQPQPMFNSLHELVADTQFMTRSAPLAAMALMTQYTGDHLQSSDRGNRIEATQIVSIGFGKPEDWQDEDELSRLYLDAHQGWQSVDTEHRQVAKFFVWPDEKLKIPNLFAGFSKAIELWCVPKRVHEAVANTLQSALKKYLEEFPALTGFQFFLWRGDDSSPPKTAMLPNRDRPSKKEQVIGFFAPYRDPSLVAGVLWLQSSGESEKVWQILNAYSDILLDLRKHNGLLVNRLDGSKEIAPATLTKEHTRLVQRMVRARVPALLKSLGN